MHAAEIIEGKMQIHSSPKIFDLSRKGIREPGESVKRETEVKTNLSGWDKAICDVRKGIARLKVALDDCEKKKAAGEPWPGGNSDATPRA